MNKESAKQFKELIENNTLTLEKDGKKIVLEYDQIQHFAYMQSILNARETIATYVDRKFFGEKETKYLEERVDDFDFCADVAVVIDEECLVDDLQMAEINTLEWALSSDEAQKWLSSH